MTEVVGDGRKQNGWKYTSGKLSSCLTKPKNGYSFENQIVKQTLK